MDNKQAAPLVFGDYLIKKGVITSEQLQRALYVQICRGLLFGECAVNKGKMSEEQVKEARNIQRSKMHPDKKIGQVAEMLGILDNDDIDKILEGQKNSQKKLGDILAEQEVLIRVDVDAHLADFHSMKDSMG